MNPDNARPIRITAAAGTYLAGASSAGTVVRSSPLKAVYDPKAFVPHAALLRQGCPHCAKFPTAASRRSLGRISVPMWPVGLSTRLPVVGTVGRLPRRLPDGPRPHPLAARAFPERHAAAPEYPVLARLSGGYPWGGGRLVTCYSPVRHFMSVRRSGSSFDLHVLGTPPAFILSQDRTLRPKYVGPRARPVLSVTR